MGGRQSTDQGRSAPRDPPASDGAFRNFSSFLERTRPQLYEHSPLVRLPVIERYLKDSFGIEQEVFAKIELNRTGTFKDRAAERQVQAAKQGGFSEISAASSGNFAEALAFYSRREQIALRLFMPGDNLSPNARQRLVGECGAQVIEVRGSDYDVALHESNLYASHRREIVYNANPGVRCKSIDNAKIQIEANAEIARELCEQLKALGIKKPGLVACPAGNGTLAAALREGFKEQRVNPRLFVATSQNPLVKAAMSRWRKCPNLTGPIHVTVLNEAGAGSCAVDGKQALEAVYDSGGKVVEVDSPAIERAMNLLDEAIQQETGCFKRKPIRVLPFAAAGLAGMIKHPEILQLLTSGRRKSIDGPIVLLITGVEDGGS